MLASIAAMALPKLFWYAPNGDSLTILTFRRAVFQSVRRLLIQAGVPPASLYVDNDGKVVREVLGRGRQLGHGDWAGWYEWTMTVRDTEPPITQA